MTPRTFSIVAIAALISVAAATVAVSREQGFTTSNRGEPVFPGLIENINTVSKLELRLNERTMTMELTAGGWEMRESGGYPIQSKIIKHAILGFSNLRFVGQKTKKKDLYLKLGLRAPEEEGSKGRAVKVFGKDGTELVDVVLGTARYNMPGTTRDGVYFRRPGDPQTWLGVGQLEIGRLASDWLKTDIINIDAKRIKSARFRHPDGETIFVSRPQPSGKGFSMADIPDGKKLKYDRDPTTIATVLEDFELEDAKRVESKLFNTNNVITARFSTFDGLFIDIKMTKTAKKKAGKPILWVTISATSSTEETAIEAAEINEKTSPWMYRLPGYKSARLNKRRADLFVNIAPPS